MRAKHKLLWMTLTVLICGPADAAPYRAMCSYDDIAKRLFIDGPCVLTETTTNGNFAYVITLKGGVKVIVEYLDSQGPDHKWKINGESAMGFEINRDHLHGATLDLNQSIDWQ